MQSKLENQVFYVENMYLSLKKKKRGLLIMITEQNRVKIKPKHRNNSWSLHIV